MLKKNIIPALFIVFLGIFGFVNYSLSDSVGFQDANFTYVFYLFRFEGGLTADRDAKFPFDIVAKEYQLPAVSSGFGVEIWSVSNVKLADVPLDFVKNGAGGRVKAEAPYFSNAKRAVFYNPDKFKILVINLAPNGAVCNEDGTCNADTGENNKNCPADCKVAPTPSPTPTVTPESRPSLLNRIFSPINLIGTIIILALVFIFFWLRKKKQNVLPPQI